MNSYKIAVCLSGQPRWWKFCVQNIKNFFNHEHNLYHNKNVETDYFIHIWDTNTWRFPKQQHTIFQNEKHNDLSEIAGAYNPIEIKQTEWKEGMFRDRAWDPMWYSFANTILMKRKYEIENNFEYDLVIKARLDVIYDPTTKFPLHRLGSKHCYTSRPITEFPTEFNYFNFDDVIFYGRSNTMNLAGDILKYQQMIYTQDYIDKRHNMHNLDPAANWYGPGTGMYDYLFNSAIYPTCVNPFDYAVVRSTIVKENIDPMKDYERIKELAREWYI